MWEIHHRRECDSEGRTLFTRKQLKDMNLYLNRPASELIFVTRAMHLKLHRELREKCWKIAGKKNSISILQFTKSDEFMKEWSSLSEAYRQLGISPGNICNCLKGTRKSAGGFVWRYK